MVPIMLFSNLLEIDIDPPDIDTALPQIKLPIETTVSGIR